MDDDTLLMISLDGDSCESKTVEQIRELIRSGADRDTLLILDTRGDSPEWLTAKEFGGKKSANGYTQ
jgi:hypothetical protein